MIVDHIKNRGRYEHCHKNIAAALQFIAEHADDPELKDGSYPVIPDEVIVHVLTKETHGRDEAKMEIHKNFMDIHYIIKGAESCAVAPLAPEQDIAYDPNTDNAFWDYAVWPMEPHCPLCNTAEEPETIRKIICKVKVD